MQLQAIKETTKTFVLDAEAVAIDRTTAKLMPFQELSKRKRKDVKVEDIQVRVCLFAFDLLYLNGEVSHSFGYLLFLTFYSHCYKKRCKSADNSYKNTLIQFLLNSSLRKPPTGKPLTKFNPFWRKV